jgi:hypothetical protein
MFILSYTNAESCFNYTRIVATREVGVELAKRIIDQSDAAEEYFVTADTPAEWTAVSDDSGEAWSVTEQKVFDTIDALEKDYNAHVEGEE